jgi:outer membrane protein W
MHKAQRTAILLSLLLLTSNFFASQSAQVAELKNIRFQKTDSGVEVTIEIPSGITYESFSLMNPNRLVLDFSGITAVSSPAMIEIQTLGVVSVRSAMNRPGVARVVFNFTGDVPQFRIEEKETGLTVFFWKEMLMEAARTEEKEPEKEILQKEKTGEKEEPKIQPEKDSPPPLKKPAAAYEQKENSRPQKKMSLGFTSGYMALQEEVFKDTYGTGGVFFRGEYALVLPLNIQSFDIWTGFSYFKKTGKTTITEESLDLKITTLSLALRYLRQLSRFTPFAGAGIDYIVYKEILPEEFMIASVGGSDLGFHVQGGTYVNILPHLSLKAHIRYLWSKTTEDEITVNLGGVEYGLGVVFRFNL